MKFQPPNEGTRAHLEIRYLNKASYQLTESKGYRASLKGSGNKAEPLVELKGI